MTPPSPAVAAQSSERGASLEALAALAREASAVSVADDAEALAARLAEGRFYVAVLGQFKRGKSTLLNALLGEPILPVGVAPVTTVVTVVRHGAPGVRVQRRGEAWEDIPASDLASYVAEEHNRDNQLGVTGVEVCLPVPILATGMCLVDTPGVGSVFDAATEATRRFVPHVDAALVVLGGDPPVSAEELHLIEQVGAHAPELRVVLNKADRMSPADLQEAARFTRHVLEERLGRPIQPFQVSALERLEGGAPTRDWQAFETDLRALATEAGAPLVAAAERRGLRALGQRLQRSLEERGRALEDPLEASEARLAALRTCVEDAERSLGDLAHLMAAEQKRLSHAYGERCRTFIEQALAPGAESLRERLRQSPLQRRALRAFAVAQAQDIARHLVDEWRSREQPVAEDLYRQAAQRFVDMANAFLQRLATTDPSLEGLHANIPPETGFRTRSRLYFHDIIHRATTSPARFVGDWILPAASVRRAVETRGCDYLQRLLQANALAVYTDLDERVLESRRRLESNVRSRLRELRQDAERALESARAAQARGEEAVASEKARIDGLRARVEASLPNDEARP